MGDRELTTEGRERNLENDGENVASSGFGFGEHLCFPAGRPDVLLSRHGSTIDHIFWPFATYKNDVGRRETQTHAEVATDQHGQ